MHTTVCEQKSCENPHALGKPLEIIGDCYDRGTDDSCFHMRNEEGNEDAAFIRHNQLIRLYYLRDGNNMKSPSFQIHVFWYLFPRANLFNSVLSASTL